MQQQILQQYSFLPCFHKLLYFINNWRTYAFFLRFRCTTVLLKAFIIAGDNSSQSSSNIIGLFFASSISFSCSSVGFCPLTIMNVLVIIQAPFRICCKSGCNQPNCIFLSVNTTNNISPTLPIAIYRSSSTLCSKSIISI